MASSEQLHGTAVALDGRGCLITGKAATGKSTLAFEMIALGAVLIADDRVNVTRTGQDVILSAPPRIAGLMEARGVGLVRMPHRDGVVLEVIADLDQAPGERMPVRSTRSLLGAPYPVIVLGGRTGRASILMAIMRYGLTDTEKIPPEPEEESRVTRS